MKQFFRLFPYCSYVSGEYNSCLYDMRNGEMVEISGKYRDFLNRTEISKEPITEEDTFIVNEFINLNYGKIYQNRVYSPCLNYGLKDESYERVYNLNADIKTAFLELTQKCNLECVFCGECDISPRKTGCFTWNSCQKELTEDNYINIINELVQIGCAQLVFIGGEPMLCFDLLKRLTLYALEKGITNFVIYTNGAEMTKEKAKFLVEKKFTINMQILTFQEKVGDQITHCKQYVSKINNAIALLKDYTYYFTVLIGKFNYKEVNDINNELSSLNPNATILHEFLYPHSSFVATEMLDDIISPTRAFCKICIEKFSGNKKAHNCFSNSIAIACNGDILPCILMRKNILGNVLNDNIGDIIRKEDYLSYKYLSKDKIEPCCKCAFRYGCNDCRAIESDMEITTNCSIAKKITQVCALEEVK